MRSVIVAAMAAGTAVVYQVLGLTQALPRAFAGGLVGALALDWAYPPHGSPFFGIGVVCGAAGAVLAPWAASRNRAWRVCLLATVPGAVLLIHVVTTWA